MERRAIVLVLLCSVLGGCEGEPTPRPAPPHSTTETKLELAPPEPAPTPEPAAPPVPTVPSLPPAPDPPGEAAYAHFHASGQASRAIYQGDLAAAAPHLAWLAHHEYPQKLPAAWRPHAARIQLAARVLARAVTAGEAMAAMPAFSAACGSCHTAIAHRDFNATEGPLDHGDGTMALLQGLSGPADAVFASATAMTPRIRGKTEPALLLALQKACATAAQATTWVERTRATEAIFSQCGSCHEKLR